MATFYNKEAIEWDLDPKHMNIYLTSDNCTYEIENCAITEPLRNIPA